MQGQFGSFEVYLHTSPIVCPLHVGRPLWLSFLSFVLMLLGEDLHSELNVGPLRAQSP